MPSPHYSVSIISRGRGQSAVAAAAYRHATQMRVSASEKTRDYSAKAEELKYSEIALPADAAAWAVEMFGEEAFQDALSKVMAEARAAGEELSERAAERRAWARLSQALWQSVEAGETQLNQRWRDAQLARPMVIALPHVLDRAAQIALMQEHVEAAFTSRGMIADWVLHDTGDGNPHVHVMLTMREIAVDGWGLKNRDWNHVSLLREQRALWADQANVMLEREGFAERIDHRSLRAQQLEMDVEPALEPENWNVHVAEHADRVGDVARERVRCSEVREANRAYLRAHPEHILVVVQSERAVFTRADVAAAFAKRLGLDPELEGMALEGLVDAAMAGGDLLPVVGDGRAAGERYYITTAKARQVRQVGRDAGRLAGLRLEDTSASERDAASVLRDIVEGTGAAPDRRDGAGPVPGALETGTGPVLIDIASYGEGAGDDERGENEAASGGSAGRAGGGFRGRDGVADDVGAGRHHGAVSRGGADGSRGRARSKGPSAAAVREALDARAEDLFRTVFGEPLRPGAAEWRAKENEALAMQIRGPKRGLWRDHSAGEGGDLLDLVARHYCGLGSARQDFPKVLEEAARWCGLSLGESRPDENALRRLEEKRDAREKEAALQEAQEQARRVALVRDVAGRAVPLSAGEPPTRARAATGTSAATGAPAAAYLAGRGITELPDEGLAYLPGVARGSGPKGLLGAEHDALVVWATDEAGVVTGGQRILINRDGSKADVEVRKPSFGQISGSVARFASKEGEGPLVIAEGPESALSIWQATGYETWAVFGVSGWRQAPIAVDRPVILAPDRDAPKSPAGRAFRKAVAHHLARGCDLSIATAPEPVGSKRDLNDTHQRAGPEAVRAAIVGARQVQSWLSPDLNAGQRRAAEAMLGPDRLTLVTGHAGTGKTFTLGEVARVWKSRGVEVFAGAPSGKATQALAGLGEDVQTGTLAAWESRWARGDGLPKGPFVFLMDEAGMVGSGQWARLQSRIGAMGGKLIAVGDPEQLQPVMEVSGWALAEREVRASGGAIPVMDVVMRQRAAGDRAATMALAGGDGPGIRAGVAHYATSGAFHAPEAEEVAVETLAQALVASVTRDEGQSEVFRERIALGYSNADIEALNAAIRARAVKAGLVEEGHAFRIEQVVRDIVDDVEIKRRKSGEIRIGAGDRVMLTRPLPEHDLSRSAFGTVTGAGPRGFSLRMDGRADEIEIDPADFPYFDHGYAATIHKAQGMTVDESFVLTHRGLDRYAVNVALTRHQDRVRVFGRTGHCESADALTRLALRREQMPSAPEAYADVSLVPGPAGVAGRADWSGAHESTPTGSFQGDRHLMAVGSRVAGLLGADHADSDPVLADIGDDVALPDYVAEPRQVIDDLVARQGVVLAEEVAGVLGRQVRDPETFLRLFADAMAHEGLVALPRADGRAGEEDVRVYTTQELLDAEVAALDRGLALALRGRGIGDDRVDGVADGSAAQADAPGQSGMSAPDAATISTPEAQPASTALVPSDRLGDVSAPVLAGLDEDQRGALRGLLDSGATTGLRIVEGGTGSGKTRLVVRYALALEEQGVAVTVVAPTEAGRQALLAEGMVAGGQIEAVTLGGYLSTPALRSLPVERGGEGSTRRVVIVDDAHGLGVGARAGADKGTGRASVLLARIEAEGSELVAMVNPARRPAEAGPVFQRLAERLLSEQGQAPAVLSLGGHYGPKKDDLRALAAGLRVQPVLIEAPEPNAGTDPNAVHEMRKDTAPDAGAVLRAARAAEIITAGGDREGALAAVARSYVADKHEDRLALSWSRADAAALTQAIRSRLDEIDPERAAFVPADHGPLKGLKPGDRIRFGASGMAGVPARGGTKPTPGSLAQPEARIVRGDLAEVLGPDGTGHLRLRVSNAHGENVREIAVPQEGPLPAFGPLPAWSFAFASTVMASAGRRHGSVHLLASPGMDREVLSASVNVAREAVRVVLPVAEDRLGSTLARMGARERGPRSGVDYGFDPAQSLEMASTRARAADRARDMADARAVTRTPAALEATAEADARQIGAEEMEDAGLTPEALAELLAIPRVPRSGARARAANAEYLRAHPEHILVILGADRPVFTDIDIRQGLRDRLGTVAEDRELADLGTRVLASEDLVRLSRPAPDGSPQYITRARAAQLGSLAEDAARLAGAGFAPGDGPVLRPDALDSLNPVQAVAAEAMLDAQRLTLVTGHAGTGKTHTLKAVAAEWQARGVTVLAGAPSGKATSELKGTPGVEVATLAAWEARWSRGEVPTGTATPAGEPFVFIMDEAGMVGAGQWARIQASVLAMGGKLIAVGDPEQLQPVADLPGWALANGPHPLWCWIR